MASFDSPYITRYYGSAVVGRELWIVMEYMGGGSVYDLVPLHTCPCMHTRTHTERQSEAACLTGARPPTRPCVCGCAWMGGRPRGCVPVGVRVGS
jgi:hypothetical protein